MKKFPIQSDSDDLKDSLAMPYYPGKLETKVDDMLIKVCVPV